MNRYLTRRQPHPIALALLSLIAITAGLGPVLQSQEVQSQEAPSATPASSPTSSPAIRPTLNLGSQGAAVSELQSLLKLLGYYAGTVDGFYQESTASAVSAFQQAVQLQPDGVAGTETWNRLLPVAPPVQQATAPASVIPPGAALAPVTLPGPSPAPSPTPSPTAQPSFPAPTAVTPVAPTPAPSPTPVYTPAPAPTPTAASPSTTSELEPVLRRGMEGEDVTRLQTRLQTLGLFSGSVDGVFGAETELAVQEAQRSFNLEPDGVVGPATWEALRR